MCWCAFLCCVWQPASLSVDMQTFSSCWTRHKKKSGSCETCNCLVARQPWRAALEDLGMSPIISQASITVWKLAGTRDLFFYFFNSGKCQTVDGMSQNFLGVNEFWMGFINRPHWNSLCGRSKVMCVPELQGDVSSRILTDVHSSFTIRLFRNTQCIFMKCPLTISMSYSCLKNLLESVLNVSSLSLPLIYLTSVSLFMAVWLHNTDIWDPLLPLMHKRLTSWDSVAAR